MNPLARMMEPADYPYQTNDWMVNHMSFMGWGNLANNPIFWVIALFWVAVHIVFFIILVFIAIYLWRKIQALPPTKKK